MGSICALQIRYIRFIAILLSFACSAYIFKYTLYLFGCQSFPHSRPQSGKLPPRARKGARRGAFRLPQNREIRRNNRTGWREKRPAVHIMNRSVKTARLRRRAVSRKAAAKKEGAGSDRPLLCSGMRRACRKRADGATDPINNGITVTKSRTFLKSPPVSGTRAAGFCRATTQSTSQKTVASSPQTTFKPVARSLPLQCTTVLYYSGGHMSILF